MPDARVVKKAKSDLRRGKSASTAAGEFVKEEIEHVRKGKHGARSAKQAIAIGLSEARRAGVPLKARKGTRDAAEEKKKGKKPSAKRSRATKKALKREPKRTTSKAALSRQAKSVAKRKRAK